MDIKIAQELKTILIHFKVVLLMVTQIVIRINYMKLIQVINYGIKRIIKIMITIQRALEKYRKNVHNSSKVQNKGKVFMGDSHKRKSQIKVLRNFK